MYILYIHLKGFVRSRSNIRCGEMLPKTFPINSQVKLTVKSHKFPSTKTHAHTEKAYKHKYEKPFIKKPGGEYVYRIYLNLSENTSMGWTSWGKTHRDSHKPDERPGEKISQTGKVPCGWENTRWENYSER